MYVYNVEINRVSVGLTFDLKEAQSWAKRPNSVIRKVVYLVR